MQQETPAADDSTVRPVTPSAPVPYDVVPFSGIRRRTAAHMVLSKATAPHTLCAIEADYAAVDRVRKAARLSYLPFTAQAVTIALREFPQLNASVVGDALHVHQRVNLGIAVDLGAAGLVVPVIHDIGDLKVTEIAGRVADLADRARRKKLTLDDVADGTFTVTNPGPFGTLVSAPIINQPQVAILATDGIRKRPVVLDVPGTGEVIAIRPVGTLSLSFDHRAVDGAYAAGFIHRVKVILETTDWKARL
ncbi:2-oxo acid dehydrogenase subunit E2 [Streptomyces sp. NPDC056716]|uniref:2-oxo acid dehydrogenase subunit E2 n=1 Tax=unclassified Streptomyces TaxID=2593676 RepID=UPI0036AB66FD